MSQPQRHVSTAPTPLALIKAPSSSENTRISLHTESFPSYDSAKRKAGKSKKNRDENKISKDRGNTESLSRYMRDIGAIPLLTIEEEGKYARQRIQSEAAIVRIKKSLEKKPSKNLAETTAALAAATKLYDQAVDKLQTSNLRLVVRIASGYQWSSLSLQDLISEGNIGARKAAERFDPSKGGKFSTYGAWWIKQSIKRAIADTGRTIRLPVHFVDKLGKISRTEQMLEAELGYKPSIAETAEALGMDRRKLELTKISGMSVASLNSPIAEGEAQEAGELVPDEKAVDPSLSSETADLKEQVGQALDTLDERERKIIFARFGLDGEKPLTLEQVGKKFGVTRERIRQVQNIAIKKMRTFFQRRDNQILNRLFANDN